MLASALPLAAAQLAFDRFSIGPAVVSLRQEPAPQGTSSPVWLHLHGATATVEQAFAGIGAPGVLVTLTLPGRSKIYADHFADPAAFETLWQDVTTAVRRARSAPDWRPGGLTVSSFSAGFGGVRQLLRQPAAFDRISSLVMADSIYCGYAGPVAEHRVDPALMEGFLQFARLAVEGRKRMLVTHTAQVPEGYASTTETADYLIAGVGGIRKAVSADWGSGLVQTGGFTRGGLEVAGFAGREAEDHLRQLRALGVLLARVRAPSTPQAP